MDTLIKARPICYRNNSCKFLSRLTRDIQMTLQMILISERSKHKKNIDTKGCFYIGMVTECCGNSIIIYAFETCDVEDLMIDNQYYSIYFVPKIEFLKVYLKFQVRFGEFKYSFSLDIFSLELQIVTIKTSNNIELANTQFRNKFVEYLCIVHKLSIPEISTLLGDTSYKASISNFSDDAIPESVKLFYKKILEYAFEYIHCGPFDMQIADFTRSLYYEIRSRINKKLYEGIPKLNDVIDRLTECRLVSIGVGLQAMKSKLFLLNIPIFVDLRTNYDEFYTSEQHKKDKTQSIIHSLLYTIFRPDSNISDTDKVTEIKLPTLSDFQFSPVNK